MVMGIFSLLIDIVILTLSRVPPFWHSNSAHIIYWVNYLSNSNIVSWVILCFMILVFVYLFYARLLQALLVRMELPELSRSHLIDASWYAGLCGASIPGCLSKLFLEYKLEDIEHAIQVLYNENMFVSEDTIPDYLITLFIIFCALNAHSVSLTLVKKGLNIEFFTRLSFFLFFASTYSLRCVLLGLVCVMMINSSVFCAEVTRIFCILNRKKSYHIYSMKYIAYLFFMIHCVLWCATFLYVLPMKVIMGIFHMRVKPARMSALLLLNFNLWTFFWLEIFSSPSTKFLWNWLWGWYNNMGQRDLLDCSLFPPRNDVLRELRIIRSKIREQQKCTTTINRQKTFFFEHRTEKRKSKEVRPATPTTSKKALYQTVKCIMTLKRKLKYLREQKSAKAVSPEVNEEIAEEMEQLQEFDPDNEEE